MVCGINSCANKDEFILLGYRITIKQMVVIMCNAIPFAKLGNIVAKVVSLNNVMVYFMVNVMVYVMFSCNVIIHDCPLFSHKFEIGVMFLIDSCKKLCVQRIV